MLLESIAGGNAPLQPDQALQRYIVELPRCAAMLPDDDADRARVSPVVAMELHRLTTTPAVTRRVSHVRWRGNSGAS